MLKRTGQGHKASDNKWLRNLLLCWFVFWLFTGLALILLAGRAIVPLWAENHRQQASYRHLVAQNTGLENRVSQLDNRITAMKGDPQYAEHIVRRQLNLRKPGQEILAVQPAAIDIDRVELEAPDKLEPFGRWWIKPFLSADKRRWFAVFSSALLFAAFMVALGARKEMILGSGQ